MAAEPESQPAVEWVVERRRIGKLVHQINGGMTTVLGYAEFLDDSLAADHPGKNDARELIASCENVVQLLRTLQQLLTSNPPAPPPA